MRNFLSKDTFKYRRYLFGIFLLLVAVLVLVPVLRNGSESPQKEDKLAAVTTASVQRLSRQSDPVTSVGEVISVSSATVKPQSRGRIEKVYKEEGDYVRAGEVIARLNNNSEAAGVSQAQAGVDAQRAQLENLLRRTGSGSASSTLAATRSQQNQLVENAYRSLLNTDLQAYPLGNNLKEETPTITGTYTGDQKGRYIIEVYESNSRTGASFWYSGLERGAETVTTKESVPLGDRGLYIEFPDDFSTSDEWVVPVPNTRSSQYTSAQNAYLSALQNRESALAQTRVTSEQLEAQRAQIRQAESGLESARVQEQKTLIRAPVSGTLSSFDVEEGEIVSDFQTLGQVTATDALEVTAYLSPNQRTDVSAGAPASIDGVAGGRVVRISDVVDGSTQKIKATISVPATSPLQVGEFVNVAIDRKEEGESYERFQVPITALQIQGSTPVVFTVDEAGKVIAHEVTTGFVVGRHVTIISEIDPKKEIIVDARGIEVGDKVKTE